MCISTAYSSPNFNERKFAVSGIVIHYTEEELDDTIRIFLDDKREKRVSSHYVIDRDGTIYSVVPESKRAWHAGIGYWSGITDLNSVTIGIELVYLPGEEYDKRQIASLIDLCRAIQSRHEIKWVIGHSDCAFARGKIDPGPYFPWERLAQAGIGIWPDGQLHKSSLENEELLRGIGYNVDDEASAMNAFVLHFCPGAENNGSRIRSCLEAVYSASLANTDVLVSQGQREWINKKFKRKIAKLAKGGRKEREIRQEFWKYVGVGSKEVTRYSNRLLYKGKDPRNCDRGILEKCLAWIGATYQDFIEAGKSMAGDVSQEHGSERHDESVDFFTLAEKCLGNAISKGDKECIDETLHLIDAVIFTQPRFTAGQLKRIIFSIGEFLHMCRDRPIPPVSASQKGYGYGWYRLWLWMKRIVSVLRKTTGQAERDAETGTRLGLFIPWCEIICVKMLRHKLFMKSVQNAPGFLLAEIRTTIRHSFLQSLCDGAEYYLDDCLNRHSSRKVIDELIGIRRMIPNLDENGCRENALRVLEILKHPLESINLNSIRANARTDIQKATDILQARIVLGLIMENWGRYLCYSSDKGDQKLLESLIASAEISAWTSEISLMCKDVENNVDADYSAISSIPLDQEFLVLLLSLVSDILFLKARQMDSWKCSDKRLDIRKLLQSAYITGKVLKDFIERTTRKFKGTILVDDKIYADLARKVGFYARYWFDNCAYFEHENNGKRADKWLTLKDDGVMKCVRDLYDGLNLRLPWKIEIGEKRGQILDKLYWDFEMELWIEYDLRLACFTRLSEKEAMKELPLSKIREWGWWGASLDNFDSAFGFDDPFKVFAQIVMLYSEMTWPSEASTDDHSRDLTACRQWAAKKLGCNFYEPRDTKVSPAERLKLAMGTLLQFPNNPKGETDSGKYNYYNHGEATAFVVWATDVLESSGTLYKWDDIEAVRTFIKTVLSDFIYLCRYVVRNSEGNEERVYLKKILRRKGEVPYPWDCEEEIRRCADRLGCLIPQTKTPPKQGECGPKESVKIKDITSEGYVKLYNWIRLWRGDMARERDVAPALGASVSCLSYLITGRVDKVSLIKRKSIMSHASDILGVECSEILEEISAERMRREESIVFGNLDVDTVDGDKRLEHFVRALRNTSMGRKWGFSENMEFYERGLAQYFSNLHETGGESKGKTSALFVEWQKAKYSSTELLSTIRGMMRQGGDFYHMPNVDRWFAKTRFSGAGDAVNILKLGFVGLELLASDPDRKMGQELLRDVVFRCGEQLVSAKPDWDGTKVLNEAISHLRSW